MVAGTRVVAVELWGRIWTQSEGKADGIYLKIGSSIQGKKESRMILKLLARLLNHKMSSDSKYVS